jgi:hypothetical protein
MNNELFENKDQELILAQVEKDVDSIVDLESAKAFAEKYDWYAKWYVEKNKIIRESTTINNYNNDNLSLEELIERVGTYCNSTENKIEGFIIQNINYYRETIGLPILK